MRRKITAYAAWLMALLAMAQVALLPRAVRADQPSLRSASTPVIGVTYVPAYGEQGAIQGRAFCEDGSDIDPSDYRIAIFIQLSDGGTYWPKPTYDQPYCACQEGGFYTGRFITGGDDVYAKRIHLYLVTSGYSSGQVSDAQAQALDYVVIERTEDGGVVVSPERQVPEPDYEAPAMPTALPVSQDRIAVDVDFHTDGSGPGTSLSEALIRKQLDALSSFADCVRLYSAGGEEAKAYAIAHEMGFSIVGTAYLCGDADKDRAEMDALIEHCNKGYVQVACVGNETLLDTGSGPTLTPSELIANIRYVRERLKDASIPVTTSDSVDVLIDNPAVRNACNLCFPNCYPYWGGVEIDRAAESFTASISTLQAVAGGKQVIVSEAGHPTGGDANGNAVPGEEQAGRYFEELRAWSVRTGTQVFYFMAADCPWKSVAAYGGEGSVGAHWGILTSDFELKEGYAGTSFFAELGIGTGCVHHAVADEARAATCTEAGLSAGSHCSVCGAVLSAQREIPAKGHAWGDWVCTRPATEQADGEETRTCANDPSHVQTRSIPKLESATTPVIGVTFVPALGERGDILGRVFSEDCSDFSPSNYRIALFLQIADGERYWPKPWYDQPYTTLEEDGTFKGKFITGGDDINAKILHLYLVPSSYASGELADAQAQAIDYVRIERDKDGGVAVTPERQTPDPAAWKRLSGNGRYDTMAAIVREGFASAREAILCTGKNFPDALVAASLAGALDGDVPVVLTKPSELSKQAKAELTRLKVSKVYVLGGAAAVSDEVLQALSAMGIPCERIAGTSRQETSLKVMQRMYEMGEYRDTIVVATGKKAYDKNGNEKNFADALSIGPWCYKSGTPILLTNNAGRLTDAQVKAVQALGGVKRLIIVGGKAVVSDDVIGQLGVSEEAVERLAGSDRYKTSQIIAAWELARGMTMANVSVTTGANFPDALAGAALCGKSNSVLVLAKGKGSVGLSFIKAHKAGIRTGYALGGEAAVSAGLFSYLKDLTK